MQLISTYFFVFLLPVLTQARAVSQGISLDSYTSTDASNNIVSKDNGKDPYISYCGIPGVYIWPYGICSGIWNSLTTPELPEYRVPSSLPNIPNNPIPPVFTPNGQPNQSGGIRCRVPNTIGHSLVILKLMVSSPKAYAASFEAVLLKRSPTASKSLHEEAVQKKQMSLSCGFPLLWTYPCEWSENSRVQILLCLPDLFLKYIVLISWNMVSSITSSLSLYFKSKTYSSIEKQKIIQFGKSFFPAPTSQLPAPVLSRNPHPVCQVGPHGINACVNGAASVLHSHCIFSASRKLLVFLVNIPSSLAFPDPRRFVPSFISILRRRDGTCSIGTWPICIDSSPPPTPPTFPPLSPLPVPPSLPTTITPGDKGTNDGDILCDNGHGGITIYKSGASSFSIPNRHFLPTRILATIANIPSPLSIPYPLRFNSVHHSLLKRRHNYSELLSARSGLSSPPPVSPNFAGLKNKINQLFGNDPNTH